MHYKKPNIICYRITQIASWFVAAFIFKRKIIRNEIKGKKGPFVVLANHEAKLDFINIIGISRRPMTFVISKSFYESLPINGFLRWLGVIPKQQFQTTVNDMKRIKAVTDNGESLVIYPAGLMCEDGLSTPIPQATYKFIKWLGADVYAARTSGTYFAMPKWAKGMRAGRTYLDVYKLFSKEELSGLDTCEIERRTKEALVFDAYRDQEKLKVKYRGADDIRGLENVLCMCPHCKTEFSITAADKNTLRCEKCGYEQKCDEYGFLHNVGGIGQELRYVSDWSRLIYSELKEKIISGAEGRLVSDVEIQMIDFKKHKFSSVGNGTLTLDRSGFEIAAVLNGKEEKFYVPIANIPTLPFGPGKYLEIQNGGDIYRCLPKDGKLVMKYINTVKIFYELSLKEG